MEESATTSRSSGFVEPVLEVLRAESDLGLLRRLVDISIDLEGDSAVDALFQGRGLAGVSDGRVAPELREVQTAVRIAEEVARRAAAERSSRRRLQCPEDLASVAKAELAGANRERLLLLVCDSGNRLMHATVVTEGSADRLLIPVREILSLVLQHGGRAFAVAHNHPSGDTTPSPADIEGTCALAAAAKTVGLRFLGHVVIADRQWQAVGSSEVREGCVDG